MAAAEDLARRRLKTSPGGAVTRDRWRNATQAANPSPGARIGSAEPSPHAGHRLAPELSDGELSGPTPKHDVGGLAHGREVLRDASGGTSGPARRASNGGPPGSDAKRRPPLVDRRDGAGSPLTVVVAYAHFHPLVFSYLLTGLGLLWALECREARGFRCPSSFFRRWP